MQRSDLLITLGSNPLPVVVAALHLHARHQDIRVHIVYTRDVADMKDRVLASLDDQGIKRGIALEVDPYDATAIRRDLDQHWSSLGDNPMLGYVGGTNQMIAQVYSRWQQTAGTTARAFYLSEKGDLHFDDGAIERAGVKLKLDELIRLHLDGAKLEIGSRKETYGARLEVARRIHAYVRDNGYDAWTKLFPPIYFTGHVPFCHDGACLDWQHPSTNKPTGGIYVEWHAANEMNFVDNSPFVLHDWLPVTQVTGCTGTSLDNLAQQLDKKGGAKKRRRDTVTWLSGDWLEVWLADYLCGLSDAEGVPLFDEVHQDVTAHGNPGKAQFQADVVAVRGHRAYLFSCTTDRTKDRVKLKLFEAKQRVVKLGGEHARVAMVSMHHEPLAVLKEAVEDGWTGYDRDRVFGHDHVLGKAAPVTLGANRPRTMAEALQDWVAA